MKIHYKSNNSGGGWWLSDQDWLALELAGWTVDWKAGQASPVTGKLYKEGRWLGALATEASKEFSSLEDARAEFAEITKQDPDDDGCECCGPPHYFYEDQQ